jgi:hypothetical protein
MPTLMICSQHKEAAVAHLAVDPCPLCRALDEIDLLNSRLNTARNDLRGMREVENVNER